MRNFLFALLVVPFLFTACQDKSTRQMEGSAVATGNVSAFYVALESFVADPKDDTCVSLKALADLRALAVKEDKGAILDKFDFDGMVLAPYMEKFDIADAQQQLEALMGKYEDASLIPFGKYMEILFPKCADDLTLKTMLEVIRRLYDKNADLLLAAFRNASLNEAMADREKYILIAECSAAADYFIRNDVFTYAKSLSIDSTLEKEQTNIDALLQSAPECIGKILGKSEKFALKTNTNYGGQLAPNYIEFKAGDSISTQIQPFEGYGVSEIYVNDKPYNSDQLADIMNKNGGWLKFEGVKENITVKVNFITKEKLFDIKTSINGPGEINPSYIQVQPGASQALTIKPWGGSITWMKIDGQELTTTQIQALMLADGSAAIVNFDNIQANHMVEATFSVKDPAVPSYEVKTSWSGPGEINPNYSLVKENESITLAIKPYVGIISWIKVDGVPLTAAQMADLVNADGVTRYTFNGVTKAHHIDAGFTEPAK